MNFQICATITACNRAWRAFYNKGKENIKYMAKEKFVRQMRSYSYTIIMYILTTCMNFYNFIYKRDKIYYTFLYKNYIEQIEWMRLNIVREDQEDKFFLKNKWYRIMSVIFKELDINMLKKIITKQ